MMCLQTRTLHYCLVHPKALDISWSRQARLAQPHTTRTHTHTSYTLCPPSVNEENVSVMRRRWVAAGKPQLPDWKALMAGLVDE